MGTHMAQGEREWVPLSPFRKNVIELMRLSCKVPLVTADRRMHLAPPVARALADMEQTLLADIASEIREIGGSERAV